MGYGNQAYGRSQAGALAPRDIEAAAFLFVNRALEQAGSHRSKVEALCKNQKLWSLLLKDLACSSNALPDVLKMDLVRLATWSMAYSIRAMNTELPFRPLIDINRDMVEALRGSNAKPAPTQAPSHTLAGSLMAAV